MVRIRALPFTAKKADVIEFFSGLKINQSGIIFLYGHRNKVVGDGFVQFSTPEDAVKALENNKKKMQDRFIEVFPSSMEEAIISDFPKYEREKFKKHK